MGGDINWSYLKDLFRDVGRLMCTAPDSEKDALLQSGGQALCYSPAIYGTTISVSSNHTSKVPLPIRLDLAIVITMLDMPASVVEVGSPQSRMEAEIHTFTMDDLINMYSWVKSIRKAIAFHKLHNCSSNQETKLSIDCHHTTNDIASETLNNNYYGPISYMKDGKLIACNGYLDASQMKLKLTHNKSKTLDFTVDITRIDTITLSRDYEPMTSQVLNVSVLSVSNLPILKKKKQVVSTYIAIRAKGNENTQTIALTDKSPYWDMVSFVY